MEETFLPLELLKTGAASMGLELSGQQLQLFDRFAQLLVEKNRQINLTRIVEPVDIVNLHFLDSLTCLAGYTPPENCRAVDIGTGAGLPGIAIKLTRPDINMTMVDATGKKIRFVQEALEQLELSRASTKCARAEELGRLSGYRHKYDVVYARAVAALPVVCELCLPLLKLGGVLVAQKSGNIESELAQSVEITGELGGSLEELRSISIPGTDISRLLVIISKKHPTPDRYPRTYAEIISGRV